LNQQSKGVEVRIVKARDYRLPVDLICSHLDQDTRALAISYVQFCSGFRADLKELARRCHQMGVPIIVDAIQALGTLRLPAGSWGIDAVACGGHKGLLGPSGVGFLYCRPEFLKTLSQAQPGLSPMLKLDKQNGWKIKILDPADARRLESGTLNFAGIYALGAGLKLLHDCGAEPLERRVLSLSTRLNQGLRSLGYQVISPAEDHELSNITVVQVPQPKDLYQYLRSLDIRASLMDAGVVRFSAHAYNLESEMDQVLEAAAKYDKIN
jgi:selenocysteine lyase/cysteine desulfurase